MLQLRCGGRPDGGRGMARLWWLWFSSGLALASAGAADPVVSRPGPTEVVGHVDVTADPAAVFALVAVSEAVAAVAGPNTTASSVADGDCLLVTTRTTHALGAATYRSRSCPDGKWSVRQELVDGDLKAVSSRWWVEALPGGGVRLYAAELCLCGGQQSQSFGRTTTASGARPPKGRQRRYDPLDSVFRVRTETGFRQVVQRVAQRLFRAALSSDSKRDYGVVCA